MTTISETLARLVAAVRRQPILSLCLTAISIRIIAFLVLAVHPIPGQGGHFVSPGLINRTTDMEQFLEVFDLYFKSTHLINGFVDFYSGGYALPRTETAWIAMAPGLPILIEIFGYKNFSPYPLSFLVLIFGSLYACMWIIWLREQGLGFFMTGLFMLLPNTIWYTVCVSSDMIFSALFGLMILVYFKYGLTRKSIISVFLLVVLSILMRSAGISFLIAFFIIYLIDINKNKQKPISIFIVISTGLIISMLSMIYYFPHFRNFSIVTTDFTLFGVYVSEFKAGLFPDLPEMINLTASRILYAGSKLLSLVGIRPSYSDIAWPFVLLRSAAGLITLPGLLYLLWTADIRIRVFVICVIAPVIFGLPMERYLLPVLPILYCYGIKFYFRLWHRIVAPAAGAQLQ